MNGGAPSSPSRSGSNKSGSSESGSGQAGRSRFAERFTLVVLGAMVVVLGCVRFVVLPARDAPEPLAFDFHNPMLDARAGERVIFYETRKPGIRRCSVVHERGLVLRPPGGPDRLGEYTDLRFGLPYLPCEVRRVHGGPDVCGGAAQEDAEGTTLVVYGLNHFGMPLTTDMRVEAIRPLWMTWEEREMVVYEVIMQRYGQALSGTWMTWLAEEAPVTGLVRWTSIIPPHETTVVYREVAPAP